MNIHNLVLCLQSGQSEFVTLFKVFNQWTDPGFIFESCSNFFNFPNSHFPVTTLELDLLSVAHLNKLVLLW
jgi:hypothetical protein